jgi:hypothetical protein
MRRPLLELEQPQRGAEPVQCLPQKGNFFGFIACLIEGEYPLNYGSRLSKEVEL